MSRSDQSLGIKCTHLNSPNWERTSEKNKGFPNARSLVNTFWEVFNYLIIVKISLFASPQSNMGMPLWSGGKACPLPEVIPKFSGSLSPQIPPTLTSHELEISTTRIWASDGEVLIGGANGKAKTVALEKFVNWVWRWRKFKVHKPLA